MLLLHIPLLYCSNSINKLAIMASSLELLVNYIRRKIPIQNNTTNKADQEPSTDA